MNKTRHRYLLGLQAIAALVPFFAASAFAMGAASAEDPGTETDEEKKKREEEEAKKKAKAEEDKKREDEEKAKGAKPGLSACLSGALAALKGGTPALAAAALKQEQDAHTATKATLTQAQADLTSTKASLASTETALNSVCAFFGIKAADVVGLTTDKVNGVLQAKISATATEIVAGIGIDPARAPAATGGDGQPSTRAELLKTYNSIKDPKAAAAFYAKHEKALLGA